MNGWPDPATAVGPLASGPIDSKQGGLRVDRTPLQPAAVQTVGISPHFVSVAVITQSVDEGRGCTRPAGRHPFLALAALALDLQPALTFWIVGAW